MLKLPGGKWYCKLGFQVIQKIKLTKILKNQMGEITSYKEPDSSSFMVFYSVNSHTEVMGPICGASYYST